MITLRNFYLAVFALVAVSTPIAAYSGYYAPECGWSWVSTLSGQYYWYVCN